MPQLQDIFNRIKETKKKQKTIRDAYRDELDGNSEHQELKEKIERLKDRKKEIEVNIQRNMQSSFQKIDKYKADIKMDTEMLADISISQFINGQKVEVTDEYDNTYEPLFSVKFQKTNN